MNSYLLIENMKLEVLIPFKCVWGSSAKSHKIRVSTTLDEYQKIINLKGSKDVSFTLKKQDESFYGFFNLNHIRGISSLKNRRIIQIHVTNLEAERTTKSEHRDLLLNELLD
jgi:hypothetical protein